MNVMIEISKRVLTMVRFSLEAEISRIDRVNLVGEKDWPEDFDPNDSYIYKQILDAIDIGKDNGDYISVELGIGKHNWFISDAIANYVSKNRSSIRHEDLKLLKDIFEQNRISGRQFPK